MEKKVTAKSTDILIYTPLPEEYKSAQIRFKPEEDLVGDTFTGYIANGKYGERIAVIVGDEWGNQAAKSILDEALRLYTPRLAICIGIAGSLTSDLKLGDVVHSTHVMDLTQRQKFEKDKNGSTRTKYDPQVYEANVAVNKALNRSLMNATGSSPYSSWKNACSLVNEGHFVGVLTNKLGHPAAHFKTPNAMPGKVVAHSAVIAHKEAVSDIKDTSRKLLCVDNESGGFAQACSASSVPYIVVRGISDMADETKKLTEEQFSNVFRKVAAENAARYVEHHLALMLGAIKGPQPYEHEVPKAHQLIEQAVLANEALIREELTKRSIIFKVVEDEEKMPVPRLRRHAVDAGEEVAQKRRPVEIEAVLKTEPRVLIELPRHYPDTALPWLFAHVLTEPAADGRYPIPVCVDYEEFGPPRNTLRAVLQERNLEFALNNAKYQLYLIFMDAKPGSRTKARFLTQESENHPDCSIIIFPDRNESTALGSEIEHHFLPAIYEVEAISFSSLAKYFQGSFSMTMAESEMVAKRLLSTFSEYRLRLHPTYLASIQKDTIAAFIEANQRGELIELAVAGMLTLIVSDDRANVVLHRTTRERFLQRLAVNIYSEKKQFDEAQLRDYVEDFAQEFGFDIEPRRYIASFVDGGVLAFVDGRVEIVVPVIRTYMLAKGLVAEGDAGRAYFDFDSPHIDFATFDLYAEFSDDSGLYNWYNERLEHSIEYFESKHRKTDTTVDATTFSSHMLSRTLDVHAISKNLDARATELVEATSLVSEKQAQLDIQAEILESEEAKEIDLSSETEFRDEHTALARFIGGTCLLGAAAEKMPSIAKTRMIANLLKLADLICIDLLTLYSRFDVDKVVEDVMSKVEENDEVTFESAEAKEKLRKLVELMTSSYDFYMTLRPFRIIIELFCESGRTNVLHSPIKKAVPENSLQEFFRTAWAFDMDPAASKDMPKKLSKTLGYSALLRVAFGRGMLDRVYWYHHERDKKELVVEGAKEMLQPISLIPSMDESDD